MQAEEKRAQIKKRHIFRVAACSFLIALIFAALTIISIYRDKKEVSETSDRLVTLYQLYTLSIFEYIDDLLKSFAPYYFKADKSQTELMNNILRSRVAADPAIHFFAITDKNKNLISIFPEGHLTGGGAHKDFVIDPSKKDGIGISEPIYTFCDQTPAISLTRAAYDKNGMIAGYISALIDLQEMDRLYEEVSNQSEIYSTSLLNQNGKVLARTRGGSKYFNKPYEILLDDPSFFSANIDHIEGRNIDGESALLSVRRIDNFRLLTVTGVLTKNVYTKIFIMIGILFIVWVVFSIATYLVSLQLYKNDMALMTEDQEYRLILQGKLNAAVKLRSHAEKLQKEQETILMQKTKLSALGEMMVSIAHQWRQPLNSVALYSQDILEEFKAGQINEKYLKDAADNIVKEVDYLSQTIGDFSRLFEQEEQKNEFDAAYPARQAVNAVKHYFESMRVKLLLSLPDEPIICYGFEREISQILLNVLTNAKDAIIKHNKNGGKIDMAVYEESGFAVIDIRDNGGGVSEDNMQKLFEPYFTTKHKSKGVGLGLYMAKIAVEEHNGGKISAENIDKGMLFTIRLPIGNRRHL